MQNFFRWPLAALVLAWGSVAHPQLGITSVNHTHSPVQVVSDPLNPEYHFSVGRFGRIRVIRDWAYQPEDFAVFPPENLYFPGEGGVLSMAFSPKHISDRYVYVSYLRADQVHVVSRFVRVGEDPGELDLSSEYPIIEIPNFGDFHIGGQILFDETDRLVIGKGDGSAYQSAQDKSLFNGKMLRIDVDRDDFPLDPNRNYGIPSDNPFVGGGPIPAPGEMVHFGLRNPWRFSFDRADGTLYIADVGQSAREEVNFQPASSKGGEDYGWNRMCGVHPFPLELEQQVNDLKDALETRKIIERAKGILMDTYGLREQEAYRRIQVQSMNTRKSMREIAEAIIIAHTIQNPSQ